MRTDASSFLDNLTGEVIDAAIKPGRLLLLTQTARLRLECLDKISRTSSNEFSLWNANGQRVGIAELSEYNAELVIEMSKSDNMAFFDFAAISVSHIWDGLEVSNPFSDFLIAQNVSCGLLKLPRPQKKQSCLVARRRNSFKK